MAIHSEQFLLASLAFAFLTSAGGYWIASSSPKWYTAEKMNLFVAVSTGALLAITCLEFLPHSIAANSAAPILVLAGIMLIIFAEIFIVPMFRFLEPQKQGHTHHHHLHHTQECSTHTHETISKEVACSSVGCLLVCTFFHGLELKAAFAINQHIGWFTGLGLLSHILPDGVLVATIALAGGFTNQQAKKLSIIAGITFLVGVVAATLVGRMFGITAFILPIAAGILLYVSISHLLPIALKQKGGAYLVLAGTLFFVLLSFLMGHQH